MRRMALLTTAILVSGCGIVGDDGVERIYEVAAYKGGCFGLFPTTCLQVREPGETDFGNLFETPDGFDYEWGFEYVILIEERDRPEPLPADASSIIRRLDRVISKTPVAPGTTFQLTVEPSVLEAQGGSRFTLSFEPVEIECSTAQDCAGLESAVMAQERVRLTLRFPASSAAPLEVAAWAPCPGVGGPCLSS